jgi:hypothetical protein
MNLHAEGKPYFWQEIYFATTSLCKKLRVGLTNKFFYVVIELGFFPAKRLCTGNV